MDNPVEEVEEVIHRLTQGSPKTQQETLQRYFTQKSSFTHPFCAVHNNREQILRIFQWYKIMSPKIDLTVNSIAYDKSNLILYINISQVFKIWLVPFYRAPVTLTTVLQLQQGEDVDYKHPGRELKKYYIKSQNDLYQVNQFVRFALPWGIGTTLIFIWHWIATLCCILGARLLAPVSWGQQFLAEAYPAYPNEPYLPRQSIEADDKATVPHTHSSPAQQADDVKFTRKSR